MKLELTKTHGELSASEAMRSQLEGENRDLSTHCKDYGDLSMTRMKLG